VIAAVSNGTNGANGTAGKGLEGAEQAPSPRPHTLTLRSSMLTNLDKPPQPSG